MSRILKILIFLFGLSCFSPAVYAKDINTNYKVEYFLSNVQGTVNTKVKLNIQISNLVSTIYVNKFSISFPKTFITHDINARDDNGAITPIVTNDEMNIKIDLELNNPQIGKDKVNNLLLEFNQDNLFKTNGNIWEVIIPKVEDKNHTEYTVIINLPENTNKKISIAKPIPDSNDGKKIVWNNPKTKTIYAVFGDKQYYQAELTYHLKNPKIVPVYTEVAFVPDTTYQKVYVNDIKPKPDSVYTDFDGNYIGRYFLNPKENKTVVFEAVIELFTKPREEKRILYSSLYDYQKKFLLTENQYWRIVNTPINNIQSLQDIYNFVVNKLKYNYNKLPNNYRYGAEKILQYPDQAVCIDYSDLFIAIAREKGYASRELEGYAAANDPQIRPLSLASDILHSWPEYYNEKEKLWIPVDPTWESTSGIDYYSSLDLNHIVFAIHGKMPDYPLPAGMYKIDKSKDISIKSIQIIPQSTEQIKVVSNKYFNSINDKNTYMAKLKIKNLGKSYINKAKIELESDLIKTSVNEITIDQLAPYEIKDIEFSYQSKKEKIYKKNVNLDIFFNKNKISSLSINILPYFFDIGLKFVIILLVILTIFFTFKLILRKPYHKI